MQMCPLAKTKSFLVFTMCIVLHFFLSTCSKVPLHDIAANFNVASATWFEAEQTLFVFYEVHAEQGVSADSVVEMQYETSAGIQPWQAMNAQKNVHLHVQPTCEQNAFCGSASPEVKLKPRKVKFRLRYHKLGELALEVMPPLNIVSQNASVADSHSLLIYGVFDESNKWIQWRSRHQFPNIRNIEAERLGLRRAFKIQKEAYGSVPTTARTDLNPYLYGFGQQCPSVFVSLNRGDVATPNTRSVFANEPLGSEVVEAQSVCASSIVKNAQGEFQAIAWARKNPEVRSAFESLRSPVTENSQIKILLAPCRRDIQKSHLAMQRQRLFLPEEINFCLDNYQPSELKNALSAYFGTRIEKQRPQNRDMILSIAFHHDDDSGVTSAALEDALEAILTPEVQKSSPRVTGAFVFDSLMHAPLPASLKRLVLWCPAIPAGIRNIPDTSQESCPVLPDTSDLIALGPFKFNTIPILPHRSTYVDFISRYSVDLAGKMTSLNYLAPSRTPLSENLDFGNYAVASFFNNERINTKPTDAFSYCASGSQRMSFAFAVESDINRTSLPAPKPTVIVPTPTPIPTPTPTSPPTAKGKTALPLSMLPDIHLKNPESTYQLGLIWTFPFLMKIEYVTQLAGAAKSAVGSVAFGVEFDNQTNYGTQMWSQSDFLIGKSLLICERFCNHPSFDSAGVYNVRIQWKNEYRNTCFNPQYPVAASGEMGSPNDP